MDFLRLGVELEGADVEIDFVVRVRRRAVDPAGQPGVLEALREPSPEQRGQRFGQRAPESVASVSEFAHENAIAVEVGRRGRLSDADLRS